ncbi:hypothetical protein L6452_37975 [Arctium lappa]|uniref:Uncharacterized protein n=1 Tax=Arctium lappa TaxID=4217 RepID=A0ACB8Y8L1_ARCLA|nr:hypothetical protein L6452_37975 [Arctium lappa]
MLIFISSFSFHLELRICELIVLAKTIMKIAFGISRDPLISENFGVGYMLVKQLPKGLCEKGKLDNPKSDELPRDLVPESTAESIT